MRSATRQVRSAFSCGNPRPRSVASEIAANSSASLICCEPVGRSPERRSPRGAIAAQAGGAKNSSAMPSGSRKLRPEP